MATDSDVELVGYKDWKCLLCKVHKGFHEAYHSVRDQVLTQVVSLVKLYPDTPLLITGISLGGALAALASIDLVNYLP
jgi:putative lipase involved disintegration of autophagic bodies